jgi:RNA recognition motif-containing protein
VCRFSAETTESELCRVFSAYGNVKSTKIIVDRAGVSKGYGFVTFETELEASRLHDVRNLFSSHSRMIILF